MASSRAATVEAYLAELPAERRAVVGAVLDVVRANMPAGYDESMAWGMVVWSVPLSVYPNTYNKQPLAYTALAAQKSHYALYLTCATQDEAGDGAWLRDAFARAGKKLDMGKSCLRFKKLDDLPLDAIGEFVARTPPAAFIAQHEKARGR